MKYTMQVNRRDFIGFLFRKYCKYMAYRESVFKDGGNFIARGLMNELSIEIESLIDLLIDTREKLDERLDYYARDIYRDYYRKYLRTHRHYLLKHDYNVCDELLKCFEDCK